MPPTSSSHRFRAWTTRVSNPVCSPRRASASVLVRCRLRHWCSSRSLRIFTHATPKFLPLPHSSSAMYRNAVLGARAFTSDLRTAYARFTPSNSEQRLHLLYYRGCWLRVSRCLFCRYRQFIMVFIPFPSDKGLYNPKAFFTTRHGWIRLAPIVQYSPLLPPVGVWTVSPVPVWLIILSDQLRIVALVSLYPTNKLGRHGLISRARRLLSAAQTSVSCGISVSFPGYPRPKVIPMYSHPSAARRQGSHAFRDLHV